MMGPRVSNRIGTYLWKGSEGKTLDEVRRYWTQNVNTTQFWTGDPRRIGSLEFFDKVGIFLEERRGYWYRLIDEAARRHPKGKVLEVGCGAGWEVVRWAQAGMDVHGIDLSHAALDLARKNLAQKSLTADLQTGNAEELPYENDSFDVVASLGVLHQTRSTEKAIREVHRVLRPGGEAMISMYYRYSWKILLARVAAINFEFVHEDSPITRLYSKRDMYRLFAGFEDVEVFLGHTRATESPRSDRLARVFNRFFVPTYNLLPHFVRERFGHMVAATGRKQDRSINEPGCIDETELGREDRRTAKDSLVGRGV